MIIDAEKDEENEEMLIVHVDFWRQKFQFWIFKHLNFSTKNLKHLNFSAKIRID